MSIALGDLLQVTDFQTYLGEQVLNVYYYRWSSAPTVDNSAYMPLLDDFIAEVINPVRDLQSAALAHDRVQVKNLSNGLDFAERPVGLNGLLTSTPSAIEPSYVSLGFQLVRDSLVTRNGYKRFAGVVDEQVQGNAFSGDLTDVADVVNALKKSLSVGLIEVAFPVIVKRPIPEPAGDDYLYSSVSSVIFKGLGSQNTRKAGRGA